MPGGSIADLFAVPDPEGQPGQFDPGALDAAMRGIWDERQRAGAAGGPPGEPVKPPAGTMTPAEGGASDAGGPGVAAVPPVSAPEPAADPFGTLSAEERAELVLLRQALADPERAGRVRQAYLGVEPPAPTVPPPEPEPAAQLPAHVTPDSFEAQLWRQNQELGRQVKELGERAQISESERERQRWTKAAQDAGVSFAQRYGDRLTRTEIKAVAQTAGSRGLPGALEMAYGGDVERACTDALEFVLRQTDVLFAKVLGAPAATAEPPQPGAPVVPAPQFPAGLPAQSIAEANEQRKRLLTALSTGASPVGETPQRAPLTARPGDGRLDENSRRTAVDQLAQALRGSPEG